MEIYKKYSHKINSSAKKISSCGINLPTYESLMSLEQIELILEKKFPNKFIPRYSMVSFHQISYDQVYNRGKFQFELMSDFLSKKITQHDLYNKIETHLEPVY